MTTEIASVAQITTRALAILSKAILSKKLGPVNTARFINQFSVGSGDYTQEREGIIGNPKVAEVAAEIKKQRNPNID